MNAYPKVTAEMDRLISEKEALAYLLPMPPDEVTDNNELQVAYAKATHAWPELQPSKAKLDSVSKVEVLTADAKLKPVSVCDVLTNPAPPPAFVFLISWAPVDESTSMPPPFIITYPDSRPNAYPPVGTTTAWSSSRLMVGSLM